MRLMVSVFSIALRGAVFAVLLATQFSCNYLPKATAKSPDDWLQTVAQRQQLSSWKLTGRLGMQTEDNGGSLDLFWNQQDETYKIRLIATMGQGTILIQSDGHSVMLRTSEGETYADSADELLADSLGVSVPLSGLHDWLRGVPAADRPVQKQLWDDQGRLHKLVQDGWNIEMSVYKKVGEYILPHAFYLDRDDNAELEIRLLIRQWTLLNQEVS